ncbi:MAG: alpha/beta hydrolase [Bacteroidota bacterium]|nr:alpha/beta hydrolase [Bacteroidota bacterium]
MIKNYFIDVDSCNIFVQQAGDPNKPAIVLVHGASISSEFWYKQFADPLLTNNFSLYAFDLPGHGQSQKANGIDNYSLKGLGKMVNKIINALALKAFIIVTLSIASNIIGETVENLKGCKGIFMAGACVLGEKFGVASLIQPFPYMHLLSAKNASKEELEDYATYDMFHPSKEDIKIFIANYQQTDPAFRNQIGRALMESDYSDEVENIKNAKLPLALVYGKEEAIIKPYYLQDAGFHLWGNTIHLINSSC